MGTVNNGRITCIVIDSDLMALRLMKSLVGRVGRLSLLHLFDKSVDAMNFMQSREVDIVFWNIERKELFLLGLLNELDYSPKLIVTSNTYYQESTDFKYPITGQLTKPVTNYMLFSEVADHAIDNVVSDGRGKLNLQALSQVPDNLFVKVDSLLLNLVLTDILWVRAYGDYVKIHTNKKVYIVLSKFQFIIDRLPARDFARVHRSYLVRIDKISNIDQTNLMIENKLIPISRSYRKGFLDKIVVL